MKNLICSVLVLTLALGTLATQKHCYALALEGGGDRGAYQAGALYQIIMNHGDESVAYDVISGIGAGAINGAYLAQFAKGDEESAAQSLVALWRGLTQDKVFKSWGWGGIVRGLLFETGIYNNSPLKKLLSTTLKAPKRKFLYGMTDAKTGKYIQKDETAKFDDYVKGILASSSYAGIFPTVKDLDAGREYYDGSTVRSINIADAVAQCKKLVGNDESKITLDVIMNSGGTFKVKDASGFKAIRMGLRYLEILYYYRSMDLILRAKAAYKNLNFRYVVAPTSSLAGGLLPFNFEPKQIEENINHGIKDAQ